VIGASFAFSDLSIFVKLLAIVLGVGISISILMHIYGLIKYSEPLKKISSLKFYLPDYIDNAKLGELLVGKMNGYMFGFGSYKKFVVDNGIISYIFDANADKNYFTITPFRNIRKLDFPDYKYRQALIYVPKYAYEAQHELFKINHISFNTKGLYPSEVYRNENNKGDKIGLIFLIICVVVAGFLTFRLLNVNVFPNAENSYDMIKENVDKQYRKTNYPTAIFKGDDDNYYVISFDKSGSFNEVDVYAPSGAWTGAYVAVPGSQFDYGSLMRAECENSKGETIGLQLDTSTGEFIIFFDWSTTVYLEETPLYTVGGF
jgi:hypothetical protein